ncbi:NADH-quinone oxidoreductase subunit K [Myxococcus sp. CA051A]|uniref:NADH-quinone oxidoreductase subunit K n=1 Tax=unclassified Myxococcus TaxID=2648731 RepID=UPI00157B9C4F|nr:MULTISPECIES: NADH-quinone oxidoreductase subunit K [unclassified Myxococcus]NTX17156.1 NADH-quinone oxidoreductase subunit K [Myxococcus sp. CA056]NTX39284.1 NADH-quinone oxidoreductase subunit K [Myxococcus sp. CA033]NTX57127.1 NADH-quinone oxidoreductase subunit K [Myxococcus sp. CA039A]NTX65555.1 NADH-quinone oxidoreductase subunit K [Myxococcus sp. CA051A]
MNPWAVYALSGVAMFSVGLVGLFSHQHVVKRILASNIAGSGVLIVLVALARRAPSGVPDPVPHALVLTGIVVSVSSTALGVALARRMARLRAQEARASERPPGPGGEGP